MGRDSSKHKRKPVHHAEHSEYERAVEEQRRERAAVLDTMGISRNPVVRNVLATLVVLLVIAGILSFIVVYAVE